MRRDVITSELEVVRHRHATVSHDAELSWVRVEGWPLGAGWSHASTPVLVLLPGGYPTVPPDNFYVRPDLRVAGGGTPSNSSPTEVSGEQWLMFSFHVEPGDWRGDGDHRHTLADYFDGVTVRLEETD